MCTWNIHQERTYLGQINKGKRGRERGRKEGRDGWREEGMIIQNVL
jgi:hypothetical protein